MEANSDCVVNLESAVFKEFGTKILFKGYKDTAELPLIHFTYFFDLSLKRYDFERVFELIEEVRLG